MEHLLVLSPGELEILEMETKPWGLCPLAVCGPHLDQTRPRHLGQWGCGERHNKRTVGVHSLWTMQSTLLNVLPLVEILA